MSCVEIVFNLLPASLLGEHENGLKNHLFTPCLSLFERFVIMQKSIVSKENTNISLSVVIIAWNEAKNIARTIESVTHITELWPQTEILLVDSNSTDKTVAIAAQYPINIVRLKPSWYLSAAAGRYIGTKFTTGDLIQFIDGDMELDCNWLNHSLLYAQKNPSVAVIGGYRRDVHLLNGKIESEVDWGRDPLERQLEVKYIGGAMLCRRPAILEVGGFQPYLKSEEEVDLCMRLRFAGYKIVYLPHLVCRHYCIPVESLESSQRRFRLNLWLGYGQVPRYYLKTPMFWTYLIERGTFVIPLVGLLFSIFIFAWSFITRNIVFVGLWFLLMASIIIVVAIKKHSLRRALLSLLTRILVTISAVRGFFMKPRNPSEYPTDAEVVKIYSDE